MDADSSPSLAVAGNAGDLDDPLAAEVARNENERHSEESPASVENNMQVTGGPDVIDTSKDVSIPQTVSMAGSSVDDLKNEPFVKHEEPFSSLPNTAATSPPKADLESSKRKQDDALQQTSSSPSAPSESAQNHHGEGGGGDDDGQAGSAQQVAGGGASSNKKISAKELVQHVKNQKKKIQEKEAEVEALKATMNASRMKALAVVIGIVHRSRLAKVKIRVFHRWLGFAERESAAVEVERVAGLAHRASSELEVAKSDLERVSKEKAELEVAQKKLRVLLAKAKQQMSELGKAHEQFPDSFTVDDVLRRTRGPDGRVWCLVNIRKDPTAGPSAHHHEWREEASILSWLSQHPTAPLESARMLKDRPTIEDELQDRYTRASLELETTLADKQQELESLTDRFEQYKRRAELALEKAESAHQVEDAAAEQALREELSRVCRERDAMTSRVEEIRERLDASESLVSALRLREKALKEERDGLERRAGEAERAVEVARAAWEQSLAKAEAEREARARAERAEMRAVEARAEKAERELEEARRREVELREGEKTSQERLARADDRIEALRAAVARAEAKASSMEVARHLIASSSSPPPSAMNPMTTTATTNTMSASHSSSSRYPPPPPTTGSSSILSRPRGVVSTRQQSSSALVDEVGDSASVIAEQQHHHRGRRDSGEEDSEISFGGPSEMLGSVGAGSKYFVDQLGALRAAHRNERNDWQRERIALRGQIEDAIKRKEGAEERVTGLEKQVTELTLAMERQKQLAESARTVGETPDGLLYLKNAVFRFITADEDSERETLLPVITMLLKFTPEEVAVLSRETVRPDQSGGLIGGLLSRWTS